MKPSKVSVIIPVYNVAPYLAQCMDSVCHQTLQELEIICVNDGSTDTSGEILAHYAALDSRITVITQLNAGLSAARNRGLDKATGTYVYFMDSDDYMALGAMERLYLQAEQEQLDILLFGGENFWETEVLRQKYPNWGTRKRELTTDSTISGKELLNWHTEQKQFRSVVWLQFYRRSFLEQKKLRFQDGILHEDELFTALALWSAERVQCISDPLYMHRLRENSIMTEGISERNFDSRFLIFAKLLAAYLSSDMTEADKGLLRRANSLHWACKRTYCNLSTEQRKHLLEPELFAPYRALFRTINFPALLSGEENVRRFNELNQENHKLKKTIEDTACQINTHTEQIRMLEKENAALRQKLSKCASEAPPIKTGRMQRREHNMVEQPKISTIIPVYNAEKYLCQCLDSVIHQTLEEIEIICVDDGSTDRSLDILREYAKADPRIKVLMQKNLHAGVARNNGLALANGEYVHFLDSDDWIAPDMYEKMLHQIQAETADVCVCFFEKFDDQTGEITPKKNYLEKGKYVCTSNFRENPKHFLHNTVVPWNKLYSRAFLNANHIRFDDLLCSNDRSFYIHMLLKAKKIVILDESFVHYRVNNSASLVGETRIRNFECHFRSYENIWKLVEKESVANKQMVLDICLSDFFAFYQKSAGILREKVGAQLLEYIQTMPLNLLGDKVSTYSWWEPYKQLVQDQLGGRLDYDPREMCKQNTPFSNEIFSCYLKSYCSLPALDGKTPIADGLETQQRLPIVVSLTSFPDRIHALHIVIEQLLKQTVKVDRVLLWLAKSQFPNQMDDLPSKLTRMVSDVFEIRWCDEDIKPHKKYYYTMQENPEAIVITVDDDVRYMEELVEQLMVSYLKHPTSVSCMRGHTIKMYDEETYASYSKWKIEKKVLNTPSLLTLPTGVGGVLYPPHCMSPELFDMDKLQKLCLRADDLWLKWMQLKNGVSCVLLYNFIKLEYIDGTQENNLWINNVEGRGNDTAWRAIVDADDGLNIHGQSIPQLLFDEYQARFQQSAPSTPQNSVAKPQSTTKPQPSAKPKSVSRLPLEHYKRELDLVHASASYRIGRLITFIPRKIRGGIRCYQEHGIRYTLYRVKAKFLALFRAKK